MLVMQKMLSGAEMDITLMVVAYVLSLLMEVGECHLQVIVCGGYGSGGGGRYGVSRHSEYGVIVRGLPSSASWQDLKDHMRKAGDVCFAQVFRDGDGTMGLVDYTNHEDMKYAIRKLDDMEFRNPFARSYIRVKCYERSVSRSHSPSKDRGRSWNKSHS